MQAIHTTLQRIAALIAIFTNLLLIVLVKFKSHRKVGKYKYLMIYISVFEILYAIIDACAVPEIYSKKSAFLVVVQAEQAFLPTSYISSFDTLFCVFYGISMAIFAIHFIYRYLVVSEHVLVKHYDSQVIFSLLLFPLLFGVFWFWLVCYFIGPFDRADAFLRENLLDKNGLDITDITYVGAFFWPTDADGKSYAHWKSMIGFLIMSIAIVISFSLIVFFGFKCYRETNHMIKTATQSNSFNKLQSQLFYALVFQTLIPVFLMHIPACIGFAASFINMSIEFFGQLPSVTICFYPALDPLPNFFIIKSYREAIFKNFRIFKRRVFRMKGATVEVGTSLGSDIPTGGLRYQHASVPSES